jgi:ABC-2 type transport system permease protein
MRTIDLMLKDLLQVLRDRRSLLFLVAMPIVFTAIMGYAFGRSSAADPRLVVGWRDDDRGLLAAQWRRLLEGSDAVRLVDLASGTDAEAQVSNGQLAAAIVVPAGYSAATLDGEDVRVTVTADEGSGGQAAYQAVRAAYVRVLSAAQAGRATLEAAAPPGSEAERQAALARAVEAAVTAWQQPPVTIRREMAQVEPVGPQTASGFVQSSPGMIVMFAVFGLTTSATLLVAERKSGTLQRLMTTAMRPAEVIAGHLLAMMVLVLLQQALLVAAGQLLFNVDYARDALGLATVMLALALWVAALGLLIGVLAKAEEQVILISLIGMFVLSALGGAWFPLDASGPAFVAIGRLLPSAWAMDGFQNLVLRGLGFQSVLLPAGIMAAYALAFLALAVWRFRSE